MMLPQGLGQRVGLLGGTFDPVHVGHLAVAAAAREALVLDSVLFIPAARPPHKPGQVASSFADRVAMLSAAVQGQGGFFVSSLEAEREQPSYTIDTLTILRQQLGEVVELFFIVGLDAFAELATWKEYERIPSYANLVVIERPGGQPQDFADLVNRLFGGFVGRGEEQCWSFPGVRGRICLLSLPPLPVSSTQVRQRIARGESVHELVPPGVEQYIKAHGLYCRKCQGEEQIG